MITTDVFIAGAGIAGSIAALSYAKSARNVVVADPFIYDGNSKFDYRTTAYLQPSKSFLELIGVWDCKRQCYAIRSNENNRCLRVGGYWSNQK